MHKRRILLVEPKYKNKYPPIGLMKISSYHRLLGDRVRFFKGELKDLVLSELTKSCLQRLKKIDVKRDWTTSLNLISEFIRTKKTALLDDLSITDSVYSALIVKSLNYYSDIYRKKDYENFPKWDRVYVTTLFTFYWDITVETIQYAKHLVKNPDQLFVGGVLATLLPSEIEFETGVKPFKGLLDRPGMLDPQNEKAKKLIIDNLPLDYSILDEIDYQYPTGSAYFTFMTKGCTRKCSFCSVPILEPVYKQKINTKDKFAEIKNRFGEQQNLLLMDNNVLASPKFVEIIKEIKEMGFYKGATYIEPNQLDIAIANLKKGVNDTSYIRRCFRLLNDSLIKQKGTNRQKFYNILNKYQLLKLESVTKENLLISYKELSDDYEKYRSKTKRFRYVDFNQGVDARYVTDSIMKLISEIPIRPLRIAFDYWGMKDKYTNAVRLAAKYEIKELSNYILYNYHDTPEDLYNRLEINVQLCEELDLHIYSFPMKYIPLFKEEAKNRNYIGINWNRKFIRAIQSVLNVTKGIVAPGRKFFEKAFGKDIEQFRELLYMPEAYIIYRKIFEETGLTQKWRVLYSSLSIEERKEANTIIELNDFKTYHLTVKNRKILKLLQHYKVSREDAENIKLGDVDYRETKKYIKKLIQVDPFKNLTLTYDFE